MLNELWQKAQEMSKMLKTIPEDEYVVSLKIYTNLINSYIDRLKAEKRAKHKALMDCQRTRHIRARRVRRILTNIF